MEDTLREIDRIIGRINTHPEYSDRVRREIKDAMMIEAHRHSALIEAETGGLVTTREKEEICGESLRSLESAWYALSRDGELQTTTIATLGHTFSPKVQLTKGFRKRNVRFASFDEEEIPDWTQVTDRMGNLIMNLPYLELPPVTKAIGAHLGIVEIHPFMDGNGRCARLVQNFCLSQAGYPPAKIDSAEKSIYFQLIERALKDRYAGTSVLHNPSPDERVFHDFVESKVLVAAEGLEEQLRCRRAYTIEIGKIDNPAIAIAIKKLLASFGRKRQTTAYEIGMHSQGKGRYKIDILGDVGQEELKGVLDKSTTKYGGKYTLQVNRG